MNTRLINIFAVAAILSAASCSSCSKPAVPTPQTPQEIDRTAFAKGADISWVTEMESKGMKFYTGE